MGTLLQLVEADKHIGPKQLFSGASFIVNEGEHIGVIGPNGAGKTTLFKILVRELELDGGKVIEASKLRLGYLDQQSTWELTEKAEDYLEANCSLPIWTLKTLGLDLGLSEAHFNAPLQSLSGGFRMRMKLLYLIGQEPNCMLLDEPTNFLDLETLFVLEAFLKQAKCAFLLISHDRTFLNKVTSITLEVAHQKITRYEGNVDAYLAYQAERSILLEKTASKEAQKRQAIEDFASRFGAKASKAKQVQSRIKLLDKMEVTEAMPVMTLPVIRIPEPSHTGKETLNIQSATLGYPTKRVLEGVDFRLKKGEHLAVVGFNGSGKSTFLKSLSGQLGLLEGKLDIGYQVSFGYYAQHVPESLDPDMTVFEALVAEAHPQVGEQDIKDIAGALLFKGHDVEKKIGVLSGGEKSRVAIGQILLKKSPCLLLDEPTNHLDFMTVEALTQGLKKYPGTVVVVSHDRNFINEIATTILEMKDGQARYYPGTYQEYCWSVEKGMLSNSTPAAQTKSSSVKKDTPAKGVSLGKLSQAARKLEKQVAKQTNQLGRLKEKMAAAQGKPLSELTAQFSSLETEIVESEAQWLATLEAIESARQGSSD